MPRSIFTRLDCWLRNKPYPEPDHYVVHDLEELFDDRDDPLRTRVYWAARRFWANHWLCNPDNVYRKIKWAYQRVARGWDDRVVWSVDSWLDDIMPAILRQLKKEKHGTPMQVFPTGPRYKLKDGNPNKLAEKIAIRRWEKILDQIIAGFEASKRIKDHDYEDELGRMPFRRPKNVCKPCWKKIRHQRYLLERELVKRDTKIFKKGMALFAEHYWSLWD